MFYFAKISRKNTKTFLKIYANVKNVNVIDNAVIYINKNGVFRQDWHKISKRPHFFVIPQTEQVPKLQEKLKEVL